LKDYIKRLARGEFEYFVPRVQMPETVQSDIIEGSELSSFFEVEADGKISGTAYTDNADVKTDAVFKGERGTVSYRVNTAGKRPGDRIEGVFNVVTSAGEFQIPFVFTVTKKLIATDHGTIEDIQGFVKLAQEDPDDAARVFRSDDFAAVILRDDPFLNALYSQLEDQEDTLFAMKNFLEGAGFIKKDVAVNEADAGEVSVSTDKKGAIRKEYIYKKSDFSRIWRKLKIRLTRGYLDFRMKKISLDEWTSKALTRLCDDNFLRLYDGGEEDRQDFLEVEVARALMLSFSGRTKEAGEVLHGIREDLIKDRNGDGILYYTAIYIGTMINSSDANIDSVAKELFDAADSPDAPWPVILYRYHLDENGSDNASIWLTRFKDAFSKGCRSPIIYLEAIRIINREPVLLRVMNPFETQVIRFGYRYRLVENMATARVTEIVSEETRVDPTHLQCLKKLYDEYNSDEILITLCSKMIQGNLKGPEYAPVYEQAIRRGLAITRLYEYYILSLDKNVPKKLPETVLRYFIYDNNLDHSARAFLYANVIRVREKEPEIYELYRDRIQVFGAERLAGGYIDNNLIIIYRWMWDERLINSAELASQVFRLQFTYKITVDSDVPVLLHTRHGEFDVPKKTPIKDGRTYAFILDENFAPGNDCVICFEDKDGNIYTDKAFSYKAERVLEHRTLIDVNDTSCATDPYYLLYRFRKESEEGNTQTAAAFAKNLLVYEAISKSFEYELKNFLYGNADSQKTYGGPEVIAIKGDSKQITDLEDILARMLFTKAEPKDTAPVFEKLFELKQKGDVVEGYTAYQSFLYFVKKSKCDENVFSLIHSRAMAGERQLPVELAALLKKKATGDVELTQGDIRLYERILRAFVSKGWYFKFFKDINPRISVPFFISDKTVIEFTDEPGKQVTAQGPQGVIRLKETVPGIYTAPLIVFEGEKTSLRISSVHINSVKDEEEDIYDIQVEKDISVYGANPAIDSINRTIRKNNRGDTAGANDAAKELWRYRYINKELFSFV